ncbi:MAG TPA: SHOCT domain-containing protein [Acholeplasmataceae bacterium]|nr:SHOCT domain-containing protein [Acholeplasmataceae bacterium]
MQKTYNLKLLTGGVVLILTLIASFVLQNSFEKSYLTFNFTLETFLLMAVAFILILQFKSYGKTASIILVVYGAFNILYGILGSSSLSNLLGSLELEVLFILGLLLGHVLFEIAVLFVLLHVTQPRFDMKFTRRFVIGALTASLILLIAISPLVTYTTLPSVLRMVCAILSIVALYFCIVQMIEEAPVEENKPVNQTSKKQEELKKLYDRGLITQSEYEQRISDL